VRLSVANRATTGATVLLAQLPSDGLPLAPTIGRGGAGVTFANVIARATSCPNRSSSPARRDASQAQGSPLGTIGWTVARWRGGKSETHGGRAVALAPGAFELAAAIASSTGASLQSGIGPRQPATHPTPHVRSNALRYPIAAGPLEALPRDQVKHAARARSPRARALAFRVLRRMRQSVAAGPALTSPLLPDRLPVPSIPRSPMGGSVQPQPGERFQRLRIRRSSHQTQAEAQMALTTIQKRKPNFRKPRLRAFARTTFTEGGPVAALEERVAEAFKELHRGSLDNWGWRATPILRKVPTENPLVFVAPDYPVKATGELVLMDPTDVGGSIRLPDVTPDDRGYSVGIANVSTSTAPILIYTPYLQQFDTVANQYVPAPAGRINGQPTHTLNTAFATVELVFVGVDEAGFDQWIIFV
jgi:hypothetical protein